MEVQVKSLTYFHKSDLRIASDCIDFDLLRGTFSAGGWGGGMPADPLTFQRCLFVVVFQISSHAWSGRDRVVIKVSFKII